MSTLDRTGESFEARARARTAGMDWTLLGLTLAVSVFGIYMVRSAPESGLSGEPGFFLAPQLALSRAGPGVMFCIPPPSSVVVSGGACGCSVVGWWFCVSAVLLSSSSSLWLSSAAAAAGLWSLLLALLAEAGLLSSSDVVGMCCTNCCAISLTANIARGSGMEREPVSVTHPTPPTKSCVLIGVIWATSSRKEEGIGGI